MKLLNRISLDIASVVSDDKLRFKIQNLWLYILLSIVAFFMTIVNFLTDKEELMMTTFGFGVLCLINIVLLKGFKKGMFVSTIFFAIEIFFLFTFFIIVGTPEGFSAIWICLLPTCGLLFYGRKKGSIYCFVILILLIFLFWTETGRAILEYDYTTSFMLRFPMLYIAFFIIAFYLETIRSVTQSELKKAREKYEYLYIHDALTGLGNRYGFDKMIDKAVDENGKEGVVLLILDIDKFKSINDKFGHTNGDIALVKTAKLLKKVVGEQGYVCRWGGEEFAVLFENTERAKAMAELIRKNIEDMVIDFDSESIKITVSIGGIAMKSCGVNRAQFVTQADACLYQAKNNGRNQVLIKYLD